MQTVIWTVLAVVFAGFMAARVILKPILAFVTTPSSDLTWIRANLEGVLGESGSCEASDGYRSLRRNPANSQHGGGADVCSYPCPLGRHNGAKDGEDRSGVHGTRSNDGRAKPGLVSDRSGARAAGSPVPQSRPTRLSHD